MTDFIKFTEEENHLLGNLFALPKIANLEHFLYSHFSSKIENDRFDFINKVRLDKKNLTYTLTIEEANSLNNGEFEYLIQTKFHQSHNQLREFYLNNANQFDINIIKTFVKAIFYFNQNDKYYLYKEGKIISDSLNRNHFRSIIKKYTNELLKEIEWRILRIDPLDFYNYYPEDDEIKIFFENISSKGISLLNRSRFNEKSKEIYEILVPNYLSEETTIQEFLKIFSNKNNLFINKIKWVNTQNSLTYFLRQLKAKDKIANNKHFKFAEKMFVDNDMNNYKKLSGNKSIPNNAIEIDEIVNLF